MSLAHDWKDLPPCELRDKLPDTIRGLSDGYIAGQVALAAIIQLESTGGDQDGDES